jgi:hypothetical protein
LRHVFKLRRVMRLVFKLWRVQVVAYNLVIFIFQAEDYISSIPLLLIGDFSKQSVFEKSMQPHCDLLGHSMSIEA